MDVLHGSARTSHILMLALLMAGCCTSNIPPSPNTLIRLRHNDPPVEVTVWSQVKYNHTGIEFESGSTYILEPLAGEHWTDSTITSGHEGYHAWWLKPLESFRRVPTANWFALIAEVGPNETDTFLVTNSVVNASETTGELVCFANDLGFMYWNNCGSIRIKVQRKR